MKAQLEALFEQVRQELKLPSVPVIISRPEHPTHGEYTTNIAFLIAKAEKKNPREVAQTIIDHILHQVDQKASEIQALTVAGPGFINITLKPEVLLRQTSDVKRQTGMRIMVEFTDPNPFKEFHIGHLYSNAVGESLARLFEAQGHEVRRVCYQGDVGMHVAKCLWGILHRQPSDDNRQTIDVWIDTMTHKSLEERIQFLGQAYALGAKAYEDPPAGGESAKTEMQQINIMCFMAAQEQHHEEISIHYDQLFEGKKFNPELYHNIQLLYKTGRAWSLEYFETQYKLLGTKFEAYYFESMVAELGYKLVQEHVADGIFEKSDGAIIYKGEKHGLHTRVFINNLGLPTYEAKELGLAPKKYQDWQYDRSIVVTGKEIDEYFKVLLAALGELAPELAKKTRHISHGMVRLPEGKMSSRTGNVLTAEWLITEVAKLIQNDTLSVIAVASIKYSLLKVALPSDIKFDFAKSVSMEGDSGPYLLYTYARCKSVLRKVEKSISQPTTHNLQFNAEEHRLARLLMYFPELVAEAAENLSPSTICHYVTELAQEFNLFYAKHQILDNELRLWLTTATAETLQRGLKLLGIETVERM